MTSYVALLRAVNVGGTGKLPMADLRAMAAGLGLAHPRTYIASGNLIFESDHDEATLKTMLESSLATYAGKAVPVLIRSAEELATIACANPFPDAVGARCMVYFLDHPPPIDAIAHARGHQGERIALGQREIYVDYGEGIRFTKLKLPAVASGTARNANSVAKLAALAARPI